MRLGLILRLGSAKLVQVILNDLGDDLGKAEFFFGALE